MNIKLIIATLFILFSTTLSAQYQFGSETPAKIETSKDSKVDLSIYPNPTTDFFSVKNDSKVNQLVLYNWIGKRIESFTHYKGRIYDVEDLEKGIYIVRLFDQNNKVVKVLRLHRN